MTTKVSLSKNFHSLPLRNCETFWQFKSPIQPAAAARMSLRSGDFLLINSVSFSLVIQHEKKCSVFRYNPLLQLEEEIIYTVKLGFNSTLTQLLSRHNGLSKILIKSQPLWRGPSQDERVLLTGPEQEACEILENGAGQKK